MLKKSKKETNKAKKHTNTEFDIIKNDEYNDDVQIEGVEGEMHVDALKKLRKKLRACQSEKQEYLDGWQRAKADLINAKKDFEKQKRDYITFAREGLLEEMLTVVDSFDMAFSNKEAWEGVDKNWRMGVEHIYSQLMRVFTDNGLEILDPIGEKFDPQQHTSVDVEQTDNKKQEDNIASVRQKGYMLHGKIFRSPKVTVFTYKK